MRFHKKSRPYLETDLRPVSVEAGLGDRSSMPSGRSVPALNPWKSRGPHSITFSDNSRKASVGRALGDAETCYDNKPGAGVTQLVEYLLPKQKVTGSSPVSRSMLFQTALCLVRRTALGRFRFLRDVMLYGSSGTDLRRGKSEKGRAKREERKGKSEKGRAPGDSRAGGFHPQAVQQVRHTSKKPAGRTGGIGRQWSYIRSWPKVSG